MTMDENEKEATRLKDLVNSGRSSADDFLEALRAAYERGLRDGHSEALSDNPKHNCSSAFEAGRAEGYKQGGEDAVMWGKAKFVPCAAHRGVPIIGCYECSHAEGYAQAVADMQTVDSAEAKGLDAIRTARDQGYRAGVEDCHERGYDVCIRALKPGGR